MGGIEPPSASDRLEATPCEAHYYFFAKMRPSERGYISVILSIFKLQVLSRRLEPIPLNGVSGNPRE